MKELKEAGSAITANKTREIRKLIRLITSKDKKLESFERELESLGESMGDVASGWTSADLEREDVDLILAHDNALTETLTLVRLLMDQLKQMDETINYVLNL